MEFKGITIRLYNMDNKEILETHTYSLSSAYSWARYQAKIHKWKIYGAGIIDNILYVDCANMLED